MIDYISTYVHKMFTYSDVVTESNVIRKRLRL